MDSKITDRVYLGIPCYNNTVHNETVSAVSMATKHPERLAMYRTQSYSLLTNNFNLLLCEALNNRKNGITHFAMLHDDITPEFFWIDKLMDLMNKHGADAISAVSPIKNGLGLTSTALDTGTHFRVKRITMQELHHKYEPTFTHEKLLINTGLMLIDIRKDWIERCWFAFENEIRREEDGTFKSYAMSEDWFFSRLALKQGAKLFATREVKLNHWGKAQFTNAKPWGTLHTDEDNLIKEMGGQPV